MVKIGALERLEFLLEEDTGLLVSLDDDALDELCSPAISECDMPDAPHTPP